jgi:hypothetical protein
MTDKDKELVEDQYKLIKSQSKLIDTLYKALKDKPKEVIYKDNSGLRLKYEALKKEHLLLEKDSVKDKISLIKAEVRIDKMASEIVDLKFKVQNHY